MKCKVLCSTFRPEQFFLHLKYLLLGHIHFLFPPPRQKSQCLKSKFLLIGLRHAFANQQQLYREVGRWRNNTKRCAGGSERACTLYTVQYMY
jgi:hypothetical protein